MTFGTNIYKLFETPTSQVYRFEMQVVPPTAAKQTPEVVILEVRCNQCQTEMRVQANLGRARPLQPGCVPFPADGRVECPTCKATIDLSDAKRQIEAQAKAPVVS